MTDYNYPNYKRSDDGLFTGLLLGGLIGAGLALYLSTEKGKENLKVLKGQAMKYKEEIENKALIYKNQMEDKISDLRENKIDPFINEVEEKFTERVSQFRTQPQKKTKKV